MSQQRWVEFISSYQFEILYHPGKGNVVADALSRKHSVMASLMIKEWKSLEVLASHDFQPAHVSEMAYIGILVMQPTLIRKVRQMQMTDIILVNHLNDLVVDFLDECLKDWSADTE